ncbi:MAG: hypothetical protein ACJ763_07965, partial [Bdellovibrionia bacterium]
MKPSVHWMSALLLLAASRALATEAGVRPCPTFEMIVDRLTKLTGRLPISEALNEPLKDVTLRHGGWRYRIDDQKGMWVSGRSNYSRGVTEVYFRTPKRVAEGEQF